MCFLEFFFLFVDKLTSYKWYYNSGFFLILFGYHIQQCEHANLFIPPYDDRIRIGVGRIRISDQIHCCFLFSVLSFIQLNHYHFFANWKQIPPATAMMMTNNFIYNLQKKNQKSKSIKTINPFRKWFIDNWFVCVIFIFVWNSLSKKKSTDFFFA